MGSCNYSHKRSGRAGDGGDGGERGDVKKEGLSVGGSFLIFLLRSLSLVHHVTMCNWPVVTPELCKQISRETCQPEGLPR